MTVYCLKYERWLKDSRRSADSDGGASTAWRIGAKRSMETRKQVIFVLRLIVATELSLSVVACSDRVPRSSNSSLSSVELSPSAMKSGSLAGPMDSDSACKYSGAHNKNPVLTSAKVPVVTDVFSVGGLYRIDLIAESGECVAEVFMRDDAPHSAPVRLPLQMKAPCYVRRWNRNESPRTALNKQKSATPLNQMGGAQVWEIPIEGTRRRVFTVVGDCGPHRDPRVSDPSNRLRCGSYDRSVVEFDGKFYLSKVYNAKVETCALKQDEENVVYWVTARDP